MEMYNNNVEMEKTISPNKPSIMSLIKTCNKQAMELCSILNNARTGIKGNEPSNLAMENMPEPQCMYDDLSCLTHSLAKALYTANELEESLFRGD